MRRILLLLVTMVAAVLVASGVAVAATLYFSNPSQILIRDSSRWVVPRAAEPYPSEITVSGFTGTIRDVNVILKGFAHRQMEDADVLVVGPEGQTALLMSDVGGQDTWVAGLRLVFDDEATNALNDDDVLGTEEPTDGSYKPTQGTVVHSGQGNPVPTDFPSPAPKSPYGTTLSVFDGTDPNGTWQLYVLDDTKRFGTFDGGRINHGWRLRIEAPASL